MDPNSKEFKELKSFWYKKLEESGFKDLENDEGVIAWRKGQTSSDFIHNILSRRGCALQVKEHYRFASHYLHKANFKSELERQVWELYCEGLSSRKIVSELKNRPEKLKEIVFQNKVLAIINEHKLSMREVIYQEILNGNFTPEDEDNGSDYN